MTTNAMEQTAPFFGAPASLNGRLVYFAHPIDFNTLTPAQTRAMTDLRSALMRVGAVIYNPTGAFDVGMGARPNPKVSQVNRAAIMAADVMVACYPETPGVGTSMEIQLADGWGMPTLILTDAGDRSWSLAGLEHSRLIRAISPGDLDWLAEEAAEFAADDRREDHGEPMPFWVQAEESDYVPVRKHHDDAGFDLFVSEGTTLAPGEIRDVAAGCAVQFPKDIWGLILGRSSTSRTHRLLVHPGVIDTGYRGPLFVQIENLGEQPFEVERGMRLGQILPLPNLAAQMATIRTVALSPSDRGPAGFGSTGR